jgi:hypothetical protein
VKAIHNAPLFWIGHFAVVSLVNEEFYTFAGKLLLSVNYQALNWRNGFIPPSTKFKQCLSNTTENVI